MALLTAADYPEVRAAIDVTLDDTSLDDTTVGRSIFVARAEEWVASRTVDTGAHAKRAVIFKLAALLTLSVPSLLGIIHQANSQGESKATITPAEKAASLMQQAEEELGLTSDAGKRGAGSDSTALMPDIFSLAPGGRGA